MLPKQDLTENSKVSTSITKFIWRLCFSYVYVCPCEAHVLRLSIFLVDDRETQKIPLNYTLNYAPGVAPKGKSVVSTSATQFIWRLCFLYVYVSPCEAHVLRLGIFLEEDRETQKIPLIMRWIMLPEWYLTENSIVSTSATQFI